MLMSQWYIYFHEHGLKDELLNETFQLSSIAKTYAINRMKNIHYLFYIPSNVYFCQL